MTSHLADLAEILDTGEPVASVYMGASAVPWSVRWIRVADQLRSDGADPPTIRALHDAIAGRAEVAAFAGRSLEPRVLPVSGFTQPDLGRYTWPAHVLPVLAWLQERPACVIAVVGQTGAELYAVPAGEHTGCAASSVLRTCEAVLDRTGSRLLVVCGDRLTAHALARRLSPVIEVHHLTSGPRSRARRVADIMRAAARRWTDDAVADFSGRCRDRGLGVEGPRSTLDALATGRVQELLVVHPDPTWCADEAVRTALLGGTRIRVLRPDTPGAPLGGIGGLCRSTLGVVRA
ncbi:hypothetical protein Lesp02_32040 [Lentzea sp. NBRC 105346]|uniref:hypothetical protein n=1 Tax=Lentzea sp. NBRC 105346 TaxID=3032205 RepID=UPI0024A19AA9|nr:hypothetical protein [Lentzea sp. NBRC 105346]GLZ31015.1 hypothetical protein Lesp02_32040 [Lentzea sp. NBRC 105346]